MPACNRAGEPTRATTSSGSPAKRGLRSPIAALSGRGARHDAQDPPAPQTPAVQNATFRAVEEDREVMPAIEEVMAVAQTLLAVPVPAEPVRSLIMAAMLRLYRELDALRVDEGALNQAATAFLTLARRVAN